MSRLRFSKLLAALALVACDRASGGASNDAELLSPFAASSEASSRLPAASADIESVPRLTFCHMHLGICARYTGLTVDEFRDAQERCIGNDAQFDTTPCSDVDLLGTCEHWDAGEGVPEKLTLFLSKSAGFKSVAYARAFCDSGTFVEASRSRLPDAQAPADGGRVDGRHAP